jgi:hypothetical protein
MLLLERDEQLQVSQPVLPNVGLAHLTITLRSAARIVSELSGRATHPASRPGYSFFVATERELAHPKHRHERHKEENR